MVSATGASVASLSWSCFQYPHNFPGLGSENCKSHCIREHGKGTDLAKSIFLPSGRLICVKTIPSSCLFNPSLSSANTGDPRVSHCYCHYSFSYSPWQGYIVIQVLHNKDGGFLFLSLLAEVM